MMRSGQARPAPVRAIFMCDVSASSAHHVRRWCEAGHEVAAFIISHRGQKSRWRRDRWRRIFAPDWSLARTLRRNRIPLIQAPRDLQDREFLSKVDRLAPDVLISVGFHQRIPDALTARCRHGGLNLHPALLPHYRGPLPVQAMVIDRTLDRYGGVTLHRIAYGFDEGDIVAQAPLTAKDRDEPEWLAIAHARLGAELLLSSVPAFCAGLQRAHPQPKGDFRYARLTAEDLLLSPAMAIADLVLRAKAIGPLGGLQLSLDGQMYEISGVSRVTDRRTGARSKVSVRSIEFDASDGRIRMVRDGRTARRLHDIRLLQKLRKTSLT